MAISLEVREADVEFGETTPSGDTTRTDKVWQVGAVIDGTFVPFTSITQGHVDHAIQRAEAEEAKAGKDKAASKTSKTES